ncbi:hypothetical protein D1872_336220 [compost metagenome]
MALRFIFFTAFSLLDKLFTQGCRLLGHCFHQTIGGDISPSFILLALLNLSFNF